MQSVKVLGHTYGIWKFLDQGFNLSCSCDYAIGLMTLDTLPHCTGPGIKPMLASPVTQATAVRLYILDINTLSDIWLASIFYHSIVCLFTLLIVLFAELFSILGPNVYLYFFVCFISAFASYPKIKLFPTLMSWRFSTTFLSQKLSVFSLTFKSLIHLEFIFVYGVRKVSLHSFACEYSIFPELFIEKTILSHFMFLAL